MRAEVVRDWVSTAMTTLEDSFDELTELDAVAGDGDLGITVRSGAQGVRTALQELPDDVDPTELLRVVGGAFARGNPSSFAALVGAGLLAASRADFSSGSFDRAQVGRAARAAADMIASRGRSSVGQRTVLDALVPSIRTLEEASAASPDVLVSATEAARAGVEATRSMAPLKGRALWTGQRGAGHPDAGATAYLRFLEAMLATRPSAAHVEG
jgi:dihydroxyacetone kinase-like protein